MRVSTSRQFRDVVLEESGNRVEPPPGAPADQYSGWGYYQLYYKLRDSGKIGKFPVGERLKIIDLREIGEKYDWVVFKVRIFNFLFQRPFLSAGGPRAQVKVQLDAFVVIDSDFVINRQRPEPGVLAEYGFGTPVVPVPQPKSILAYGPTSLQQAFQFIVFRVLDSGEVKVRMLLVANQPTRIFQFGPLRWFAELLKRYPSGFLPKVIAALAPTIDPIERFQISPLFAFASLANAISGDVAEDLFCISREQIYRDVMAAHFSALYRFILQTLPAWSSVANWLDENDLPNWLIDGAPPLN